MYGQFRGLATTIIITNGNKQDHIKRLFDNEISKLRSIDFETNEFIEMYLKNIGYYETDYNEREKMRYNHLYLIV